MRGPVLGLAPSCHPSDTTELFHPRRSLFNLSVVPGASCVVRATKDHMRTCRFFTCCLVGCSQFTRRCGECVCLCSGSLFAYCLHFGSPPSSFISVAASRPI